jgi:hypothetical protein
VPAPLSDIGGDELGINPTADHSQADKQDGPDEPPQPWRRVPPSRQPAAVTSLSGFHGYPISEGAEQSWRDQAVQVRPR